MATFLPGHQGIVYLGPYNLSTYFNAVDTKQTAAKLNITTYQPDVTQPADQYIPGQFGGTAKLAGFFADDVGGVNEALQATFQSAAAQPMTFGIYGDTLGNPAFLWQNRTISGDIKAAAGGMVMTDIESEATGGLVYGRWVHKRGAETTGGNTATGLDGTAATSTGWRACLHVFTVTGTGTPTLNLKLQDSANNSSWADVTGGAFPAVTAAGGQYLASASPTATLRRYVRLLWTITGTGPSISFAVAFARQ